MNFSKCTFTHSKWEIERESAHRVNEQRWLSIGCWGVWGESNKEVTARTITEN